MDLVSPSQAGQTTTPSAHLHNKLFEIKAIQVLKPPGHMVSKQIHVTSQGAHMGAATASQLRKLPRPRLSEHTNSATECTALRPPWLPSHTCSKAEGGLHSSHGKLTGEERGIKCYFLKDPFPLAVSCCTQNHAPCQLPSAFFPGRRAKPLHHRPGEQTPCKEIWYLLLIPDPALPRGNHTFLCALSSQRPSRLCFHL